MSAPTLRPYQVDAIEGARAEIAAGQRRILLVAPTGSGKTIIAAEIIRRMRAIRKRALFVAGARELIFQTAEKLDAIGVHHGIVMAGVKPTASDVQVASIQTLARRELPPADLVIFDEADLARASSYERVLSHFGDAVLLGLTATPWRADGKGLGAPVKIGDVVRPMFERSIVVAKPSDLMREGYLVPVDLSKSYVFESLDTSGVKTHGGDYDEKELGEQIRSEKGRKLSGNVVAEYVARGDGRRAVCFGVNIEHSKFLASLFRDSGVRAEHVDGTTPRAERDAIFGRIRSGATQVLCNVGVLTRGVDIPPLEIAILARATKSLSLHLQMLGRVLRPAPGKTSARIFDHAGAIEREGHGLPDEDRDYSLTADLERGRKRADPTLPRTWTCLQCYTIARGADLACPNGHVRPTKPTTITMDATAQAVTLADVAQRRDGPGRHRVEIAYLAHLCETAQARGWNPQAIGVKFKARFGRWPSNAEIARAKGTVAA